MCIVHYAGEQRTKLLELAHCTVVYVEGADLSQQLRLCLDLSCIVNTLRIYALFYITLL